MWEIRPEEAKSCIQTMELLKRICYKVHGVMAVIDKQNCDKIVKMLESGCSPSAQPEDKNITLEQIQAAIDAGYPVEVVVNGETYEVKERGAENETCEI